MELRVDIIKGIFLKEGKKGEQYCASFLRKVSSPGFLRGALPPPPPPPCPPSPLLLLPFPLPPPSSPFSSFSSSFPFLLLLLLLPHPPWCRAFCSSYWAPREAGRLPEAEVLRAWEQLQGLGRLSSPRASPDAESDAPETRVLICKFLRKFSLSLIWEYLFLIFFFLFYWE